MLTSVAGTRANGDRYVYEAGEEYDLSAREAKDFCSAPADMPRAEPVGQKRQERAETR